MNNREISDITPAKRAFAWIGIWLCSFGLFSGLVIWTTFFHIPRKGGPLVVGSHPFWVIVGLLAAVASLMTFSSWLSRKRTSSQIAAMSAKPMAARQKGKSAAIIAGSVFAFAVLWALASGRAAPDWPAVVGGYLVLCAIVWADLRLILIAHRPTPEQLAEVDEARTATPAPPAPWVRAPRNPYRAEVTDEFAEYRRPKGTRGVAAGGAIFMLGMAVMSLYLGLSLLGVVPGFIRADIPLALIMLIAAVLFSLVSVQVYFTSGPQDLRVSHREKTYTFRQSAPLQASLKIVQIDRTIRDETGFPWRIIERSGPISDIAGVAVRPVTGRSITLYWVYLVWTRSEWAPMRLGFSPKQESARALQAQASEDLGVPLLPDQPRAYP